MTTDELVALLRETDPPAPPLDYNGDLELRRQFVALLWWVAQTQELLEFVRREMARR